MIDTQELVEKAFAPPPTREELIQRAQKFLFDNQECYVAQWIIQNPFARIEDYKLHFVYDDKSFSGYTVEMVKIEENV